jgi:hypothetical protein
MKKEFTIPILFRTTSQQDRKHSDDNVVRPTQAILPKMHSSQRLNTCLWNQSGPDPYLLRPCQSLRLKARAGNLIRVPYLSEEHGRESRTSFSLVPPR